MCGIGGYFATRKLGKREQTEAALSFAVMMIRLEDRGVDASGMYVIGDDPSLVSMSKGPGPATGRFDKMVSLVERNGGKQPIVVGHTRHATHGSPKINRNNHPFSVGRLVGVHNGVFAGYRKWQSKLELEGECDSEAIFRMLANTKNDSGFFEVFDRLNAYNRMVFWDKRERRLYAYTHDQHGLAFLQDRRMGVVWFATTKHHLPYQKGAYWARQGELYIATERRNGK